MSDSATLSRYLRKATGELREARGRIGELERRRTEPLAIVGMSCRFPGGVASPGQLWELVAAGGDAIGPFPEDRGWDLGRLFDPASAAGSHCREGGFLEEATGFDAEFFGISPREAREMDPQQRLLLEAAWEALEAAGLDPAGMRGSRTGVFAGVMHHDYGSGTEAAAATTGSVVSGRVAYTLGLEGPALSVDTACSSSLVATHLAAQALRGGECDLALAGGVTVLATPTVFVELSRQGGIAADGRCKAFSAAADGAGSAEGVGLVVLERLSDAERNGHAPLALIRGSAVNQDGASNGLTAPNGPAQERVIRQALADAGVSAAEIDAVEAHGTGTSLGDPIEAGALLATYGRRRESPLYLGSLKSNIGHAQAAAGVAGVIKMVLAMRHGVLPRSLHLEEPTPHVDWSSGAVELLTEPRPWESSGHPRRAGVSSFGYSGTNAHLILEEAPPRAEGGADGAEEDAAPPRLPEPHFLLSAKGEAALRDQAGRLASHLRDRPELDPREVAAALANRARLSHRAAVLGGDRGRLLEGLSALAEGRPHADLVQARALTGKLALLFPGQGPQWVGMGAALLEESSAFAEGIAACADALAPYTDFSLEAVIGGQAHDERVDVIQPALFAMTVSLAGLWRSHGVEPAAVLGHSQGEVAAAHIAGALSLEDAARVVALRSRALREELAGKGGMVSLRIGAEEAAELIEPWGEGLCVGAVNSPVSTVVSGASEPLEELIETCEAREIRARRLALDCPTHSAAAESIRERLLADLAPIEPRPATDAAFYSAMTGAPLAGTELGPEYWYASMRSAVRFGAGVESLLDAGFDAFVEASVHPVLTMAVEECAVARAGDAEVAALGTLRREEGGMERFAVSLATAHVKGVTVDRGTLFGPGRAIDLPTYPFQRRRYWLEDSGQGAGRPAAVGQSDPEHPLLGAGIALPDERGWLLTGRLSLQSQPWLGDHAVSGTAILPGTAFVELALAAAEQAGMEAVEELTIEAPLVLPEQGAVQLQVSVGEAGEAGERPVAIHSRSDEPDAEWARHASGTLSAEGAADAAVLDEWPPSGVEPLAVDDLYERTALLGIEYGPAFQGLKAAWRRGEELFAEVELAAEQAPEAERFGLHPALLDAALHATLLAAGEGGELRVPFSWAGVRLSAAGATSARVTMRTADNRLSLELADPGGAPVASIAGLAARPLDASQLRGPSVAGSLLVQEWQEVALPDGGGEEAEPGEARRVECVPAADLDPPAAAKALCEKVLAELQASIAAGDENEDRIAFLTRGAVAVAEGDLVDPAAAALGGLVRSAQAEHPGRFVLVDGDGSEASEAALAAALRIEGEPQVALREGVASVPRLTRVAATDAEPPQLDPEGTVLITGGTGTLGALFARHLAERGARHLVLLSRRGPEAPGAEELVEDLAALGAEARVVACDASDRGQLEDLLAALPPEHPLTAVLHCAATTDDGLTDSLDPERLAATMGPKASAAWHLHDLTRGAEGCRLVLFSSVAGSFPTPGQGNYAAANAFLDALAHARRAEGLPAVSLGWGGWERESALTAQLEEADRARFARRGFELLADDEGRELFDRALAFDRPHLLAVRLETNGLRAAARAGALPSLFAGLVRVPVRRAATGSLAARLASVAEPERQSYVLELVRSSVATVLGHPDGSAIDSAAAFKDLGFDSLAAIELRNQLGQVSGLRLPTTLVFDYPSAEAVAGYLLGEVEGRSAGRVAAAPSARVEEPVAIVGMSARLPGGVRSPADLWELVAAGGDAIAGFPRDRGWDLERLYDSDSNGGETSSTLEGGFLHDAGDFDAEFFGISPREALAIDPQQRLLLEAAWEALEAAGIDPTAMRGSRTGVFAGLMHHDYGLDGEQGAVASGSVVSGRVAYTLGLEGPAVTVDTACSSSLVATHLAAQALRGGECELALAGGVTVLATPNLFAEFSRQRGLAADGRCKAFAAAADGAGFGEGVGLLLLERLSDAERNGHAPLALIRGSAVNQDGASNGLTAPNGPSQERVIRQALANAGLAPAEVDAVEAHGTGTALGDPIEAGAILATYGQDRGEAGPLYLGSVKSNIGHTQAAAGVAGVIKMTLAMRNGVLPRTLHLDEPTPHVDWSAGEVELLAEQREWEPNGRPRRAAVSSFGASGTNAHLVLEEPVAREATALSAGDGAGGPERPPLPATPLLLSAKGEDALREQGARLAVRLRENPELDPLDVAATLAKRARLSHGAAAVGPGREELLGALDALAGGDPHPALLRAGAHPGKLAYLLSGQGAQRPGMGRELHEAFPAYAAAFEEVCVAFAPHLERPLAELVFAAPESEEAALLDRTEHTQPALFALEVSLFRLLESWGMAPDFLIGHSIGELTAAHLAGVFDLADACRLIAARGALMGALPEGGAMVAIEAGEEEVAPDLPPGVSIAGVNSPSSLVVSGERDAVLGVGERWAAAGRRTTRLRVSHAFHSALMDPMLADFAAVAESVSYAEPRIPVVSNLDGRPLAPERATDPAYWVAQVREPVRFAAGVEHLTGAGVTTFLELGPDSALAPMARACLEGGEAAVAAALRRDRPETESLLASLAIADLNGAAVEWTALLGDRPPVALPTYPFQRRRYWLESGAGAGDLSAAGLDDAEHPLLRAAVELPDEQGWLLTGRLSLQSHPWLADHALGGTALLPGTAFVELALQAADRAGAQTVSELVLGAPLVLPEQGAVQVQVSVGEADEAGERPIAIHSRPEGAEAEWARNATGTLTTLPAKASDPLDEWPPRGAEALDTADLYDRVAELGIEYGPAFQGLNAAWRRGTELFAEVELDEEQRSEAARFGLHPALLDAALHTVMLAASEGEELRVPFSWGGVGLHASGAVSLRVALRADGEWLELQLSDADGAPVAVVERLAARPLDPAQLQQATGSDTDSFYVLDWSELALPEDGVGEGEVRPVHCVPDPDLDPATAAQALGETVLAQLQEAIAAQDREESRIAFVTRGAVAVVDGEPADPAAAAIGGLVRAAQGEHPGRFLLVDSDGSAASEAALPAALAVTEEPQIALREGIATVPRLARCAVPETEPAPFDPDGTVLITGGTGTLGAHFARHLASAYGVRHLVLTGRRGLEAAGAVALRDELVELGVTVEVTACDVSDRTQVEALLDAVPPEHPLVAVVHSAGVIDDALVESLDPERLRRTMAPKATAAWHLHELTREIEGCELILFSSLGGIVQSAGQGNYAAANAFLDALAHARRAEGLPGASLGWGGWEDESQLSTDLDAAALAKIKGYGLVAYSASDGLELFDRARALGRPYTVPARLDNGVMRARAREGILGPLFHGLVRTPNRRSRAGADSLARRLAEVPEEEREKLVVELVRGHVAAVLGHPSASAIDPTAAFKDLGFDSMRAIELRNELERATGLRLPATLVFDHPSTAAVSGHLLERVGGDEGGGPPIEAAIEGLRAMLDELDEQERRMAGERLRSLLDGGGEGTGEPGLDELERIESASAEELLEIVDDEVGAR